MAKLKDDLRNLTTCSVCRETYSDPRILSCIHTFCLRCLEQIVRRPNKFPQCPLCRQAFRLPNEGVRAIPKNFFVQNLIEMMKVARPDDTRPCGFCAGELEADGEAAYVPEAKVYCSECKEFICDDCSLHHRKQTPTRNHAIISLGKGVVPTEVTSRNNCDKHSNEQIKLFCVNCSCAVCILCFVESHNSHECSDINKVAKEHRQQIQRNVETVSALLPKTVNRMEKEKESRTIAIGKLRALEQQINARVEEMKATIEVHRSRLLSDLAERKTRVLKQIDLQQSETERHQTILESFTAYCKEMLGRASSVDVCMCSGDLHKRTSDLQRMHQSQFEKLVSVYDASFKKFDLEKILNSERENILGKIEDNFAEMQKAEHDSRYSQLAPKQLTNQTEIKFPDYWNLKKHPQANNPQSFFVPLNRDQLFNEITALLTWRPCLRLLSKVAINNSFHEYGFRRHQSQGSPYVYDACPQTLQTAYPRALQTAYPRALETAYPQTLGTAYPQTLETAYPQAVYPQTASLQIQNIWSIQNPHLYCKYATKKELFQINSLVNDYVDVKQTIGSDVCTFKPEFKLLNSQLSSAHNERYLVCSSTAEMCQSVASNGFLLTKNSQETIITGLGIHFVDSITIDSAKQQSSHNNKLSLRQQLIPNKQRLSTPLQRGADSTNYVILSRVLLGNIFVCKEPRHFDSLPCRVRGCFGNRCSHDRSYEGTFDSIVGLEDGEIGDSRDFVILDPDQAYPEFLIQYTEYSQ